MDKNKNTRTYQGDPVSFCPVEDCESSHNPFFFRSSISLCNVTSQLILIKEGSRGKSVFSSPWIWPGLILVLANRKWQKWQVAVLSFANFHCLSQNPAASVERVQAGLLGDNRPSEWVPRLPGWPAEAILDQPALFLPPSPQAGYRQRSKCGHDQPSLAQTAQTAQLTHRFISNSLLFKPL